MRLQGVTHQCQHSAQPQSRKAIEHQSKRPRASKIPMALERVFLNAVLQDKLSIKKAAQKYHINYSTAKVLFRKLKPKKTPKCCQSSQENDNMEKTFDKHRGEEIECQVREIQRNRKSGLTNSKQEIKSPVMIISTLGWNFLRDGYPQAVS